MGSSPFTATNLPHRELSEAGQKLPEPGQELPGAAQRLKATVASEIEAEAAHHWLVAFSGGPDSCALAWALAAISRRGLDVTLAHIDHGLDPGSAARARAAGRIAERLGLPLIVERLPERSGLDRLSLEAWAREGRYDALATIARRLGCQRIATGHHADDQAETLLLRLTFGTGLFGLRGIRRRHGLVVRPMLGLPRSLLLAALDQIGLEPVLDPTNDDLRRPRNRIRHRILPEWEMERPGLIEELHGLSQTAARATARLEQFFADHLHMQRLPGGGVGLDRLRFGDLSADMRNLALSTLERLAGKRLPSSTAARSELLRQLDSGARIGCDAGNGWRWHGDGRNLRLLRREKTLARFTYTVQVPGSVSISEIGSLLRISAAPAERLEVADQATKAYLRPPSTAYRTVQVRNRRPGDRLRPAGRRRDRRLKELLIDQRIPREQRDRLPLVVVEDHLAWVPGIGIGDRFRAREGEPAWLVELSRDDSLPAGGRTDASIGDLTEDMR